MSKPLRILLLMGNFGLLILLIIILVINRNDNEGIFFFTILSILIVLSVLNIYFIRETYHGSFSLYLKRRKLEEEIKIQEAENKLKELKK